MKSLINPTSIKKNSIYTLTTKILYPTRIKDPCRPITKPQWTKRNTISRKKKGMNHIGSANEEASCQLSGTKKKKIEEAPAFFKLAKPCSWHIYLFIYLFQGYLQGH